MKFTPEKIGKLLPHQIVVFGSNTEGRHGKGFALECRLNYGAIYGQAKGLQGQCYAIITKNLKKGLRSVSLDFIYEQLVELCAFAVFHPEKEILLTKIGTNHAGFKEHELANLIKKINFPSNVILPRFENHLDQWFDIMS